MHLSTLSFLIGLYVWQAAGIDPEQTNIRRLFSHYSSGQELSRRALKHLLSDLGFSTKHSNVDAGRGISRKRMQQLLLEKECLNLQELLLLHDLDKVKCIQYDQYLTIVPTILHQNHNPKCHQPAPAFSSSSKASVEESEKESSKAISPWVWISATIAIIIISMVGLFGVAVVPLVQKTYYNQVLQFLVALAVGALTGDAMLHLLPHAIVESAMEEHGEGKELSEGHDHGEKEREAVFKGLSALGGIYFFFVAEKIVGLVSEFRAEKKAEEEERERAMKSSRKPSTFSEFLTHDKQAPVDPQQPFSRRLSTALMDDSTMTTGLSSRALKSIDTLYRFAGNEEGGERRGSSAVAPRSPGLLSVAGPVLDQCTVESDHAHAKSQNGEEVTLVVPGVEVKPSTSNDAETKKDEKTEEKVEKKDEKKGHGHSHGHSHDEVPDSVASVAWMVIMGDGLHNFTDGLAIGAAFAKDITGGLSTTIAVFCHELPHELGDFAVLLKTGMPVKQALFYNILSSVLSLLGVYIGVALGNIESTSIWIFAMTAGIFVYIALVDMLPELNMADVKPGESRLAHFAYQCGGIVTGVGIMLLIAMYEEAIKNAFGGSEGEASTEVSNSTAIPLTTMKHLI